MYVFGFMAEPADLGVDIFILGMDFFLNFILLWC